jgi:medium-chain acyl-[acyl-carrier-protein] hydrolase
MEFLNLKKEYNVHVYEMGPDGKLSLHSFFDYLQDIASDHAVSLRYGRDDLLKQNHIWVLSRIYAEINEWPSWGDKLTIMTWPRGTDRLFALRDFNVHSADGRLLALATSSWLIIDYTTRRIQRPDSTLIRFNSQQLGGNALPRNSEKLEPAAPDAQIISGLRVRVSDLDVNLHTNNARYLKWITDSYSLDFIMNHAPVSAEINYLAESRYNEEIVIRFSRENENLNAFNHSIVRISDNTELCRIRIIWKNNHQESK